ncbi:MAG: glycine cleavage system protein GcvH [Clostridiales bacterium]|jgi:glycine cleavage system H protein|nr:glycine cleavage system protein GcvH [Clostridiales bacterium]
MKILKDYYYSKEHEWAKAEGNLVRVGITDYAQETLGDIVYVELPEPGSEFQAGDVFGVVESVKAASDLYTPVSGKIVDVNEELSDNPEKINEDPYGSWMIIIEMYDSNELEKLLSPDEYRQHCEEEG